MIQIYSTRVATTLIANVTVAYYIHVLMLNFTKGFRRFPADHGDTNDGLFSVWVSESSEEIRDDDATEYFDGKY